MIYSNNNFAYNRKYFIKDLFNPREIFSHFSQITFSNFLSFYKFLEKSLFTINQKEYKIPVSNRNELQMLLKIIRETDIIKNKINIQFSSNLLEDIEELITDTTIYLSSDNSTLQNIKEKENNYIYNNTLFWTEYIITSDNYAQVYKDMIKLCIKHPVLNYIDLKIDYSSFEDKPLSELHSLFFYLSLLKKWTTEPQAAMGKNQKMITLKNSFDPVRCYVSESLDILLDKDTPYFSMGKYLDLNGEDVPLEELNTIRKLIDVKFETEYKNWYLIDLAQNQKVMEDIYETPYLAKLVQSWLL
jgi:hypothetical protein